MDSDKSTLPAKDAEKQGQENINVAVSNIKVEISEPMDKILEPMVYTKELLNEYGINLNDIKIDETSTFLEQFQKDLDDGTFESKLENDFKLNKTDLEYFENVFKELDKEIKTNENSMQKVIQHYDKLIGDIKEMNEAAEREGEEFKTKINDVKDQISDFRNKMQENIRDMMEELKKDIPCPTMEEFDMEEILDIEDKIEEKDTLIHRE